MVNRIFVEKRPGFDIESKQLLNELREILGIKGLSDIRILNRYDVEGISDDLFERCSTTVFSEPQSDYIYSSLDEALARGVENEVEAVPGSIRIPKPVEVFGVEFLPGQFDQRAESASECIQLISQGERPEVRSASIYILDGDLDSHSVKRIKDYLINPVESREADMAEIVSIATNFPEPDDVEVIDGFISFSESELTEFIKDRGLAMDLADITFMQAYFRDEEKRDPTITEVKMIDTYWSDHCRHTTFETELVNIEIEDENVQNAFEMYLDVRHDLGRDGKPVCLMDMGTIGARVLKAMGELTGLDESDEINACTVKVKVDVRGEEQDWLYLFKNETHNHPTEIEPFGGAATCLGGAIRDPLSGRAYVYQAMRVTGAADPTVPIDQTIPGKLPQRKLVTTAANGYSSYGNQIGIATGEVHEFYHPGYAAKRMEIGAVIGATPASDVVRECPQPGDVIVLLGGKTGRDGIGGATGSSKAHDTSSIETCGAEVQKGNPPVERKIQRLFRNTEACRMIKRCNDFGAGGVSVAIGELADGLKIDLDVIPRKYSGLDGTELAISESQERMAVALAPEDVVPFIGLAHTENLEATPVAEVTDDGRVRMHWRGSTIVNISREFLSSNGAPKQADVKVEDLPQVNTMPLNLDLDASLEENLSKLVADLNVSSNKGLAERFDSTIGSATVLMPFGGKKQLTPALAMVAKLPVLGGDTKTVSGLSWGFNPYLSEQNPYVGAYLAVQESISKLIATGFSRKKMYLTFQEYFEKLGTNPLRWGKPVSAILGALMAQIGFGVGAIGGKDSMSGSFEDLDVPPTLVSFATATGDIDSITSPEFKRAGDKILWLCPKGEVVSEVASVMDAVEQLIIAGKVRACSVPGYYGLAEVLFKMCVGNGVGIKLEDSISQYDLFAMNYGTFVIEVEEGETAESIRGCLSSDADCEIIELGETIDRYSMESSAGSVDLNMIQEIWESAIEDVFPYRTSSSDPEKLEEIAPISFNDGVGAIYSCKPVAQPRVIIPVFPGINCEYDTLAAFERAGAIVKTQVINNMTPEAIRRSTEELVDNIKESQIVMLPGGFSGGDEPDGSAKFITAFFRAPEVTEAVRELLQVRDGLMLGICNGFQALVKLGLVPFGDIVDMDQDCPTLTFNDIGRHQSKLVDTRICSDLSPWLSKCEVGDIHTVAISHGEGRFVAPTDLLDKMIGSGQIATQYVDSNGLPSMDLAYNPNGSVLAIEGITSPDGRILGKMGHSERSGIGLYKNVPGNLYQPIFEGGVSYFA